MSYLFSGLFVISDKPTPYTQLPSVEGSQSLSPACVMYSTSLQHRNHVETEKLQGTTLRQLVQRVLRDFALLQPQIEIFFKTVTSIPTCQTELENDIKKSAKRLSAEFYKHKSRPESSQSQ